MVNSSRRSRKGVCLEEEMMSCDDAMSSIFSQVIIQTKSDLGIDVKVNTRNGSGSGRKNRSKWDTLNAAIYFFDPGRPEDVHNLKTFTGLCNAYGVDAEKAAGDIWKQLPSSRKAQVLNLLREDEYDVSVLNLDAILTT